MPKSKCKQKWKDAYTKAEANEVLKRMKKQGRGRGLHAYQCPEGHWHVGSIHAHFRKQRAKQRKR